MNDPITWGEVFRASSGAVGIVLILYALWIGVSLYSSSSRGDSGLYGCSALIAFVAGCAALFVAVRL